MMVDVVQEAPGYLRISVDGDTEIVLPVEEAAALANLLALKVRQAADPDPLRATRYLIEVTHPWHEPIETTVNVAGLADDGPNSRAAVAAALRAALWQVEETISSDSAGDNVVRLPGAVAGQARAEPSEPDAGTVRMAAAAFQAARDGDLRAIAFVGLRRDGDVMSGISASARDAYFVHLGALVDLVSRFRVPTAGNPAGGV